MVSQKIPFQRIAIRTLVKVVLMFGILLIFNTWTGIKQGLSGDMPPLSYWLGYILKWNTIIPLLIFGVYFYYQDWNGQKEVIENERKIIEKHNSWMEDEQS